MLLRVVPEEGQDVLPEELNAVGEGAALIDIAFEPVSSNRSLRCRETEFSGQRQRGRNGSRRFKVVARDKISLNNPANSGLIAGNQEISVRARMRGGAGRTRTPNQAVMKQVALRTIRDKISASKRKGLWVGGMAPLAMTPRGAKSLSMS